MKDYASTQRSELIREASAPEPGKVRKFLRSLKGPRGQVQENLETVVTVGSALSIVPAFNKYYSLLSNQIDSARNYIDNPNSSFHFTPGETIMMVGGAAVALTAAILGHYASRAVFDGIRKGVDYFKK